MGRIASASFTPTAAAYTAGDVFDTIKQFAEIGPPGGGYIKIVTTRLVIAHTALVASEGAYTLHLFSAALATPITDNSAFDVVAAERDNYLGFLSLGTPVDVGSSLIVSVDGINRLIKVPSGGSIYGHLVNAATITPTAAARKVFLVAEMVNDL